MMIGVDTCIVDEGSISKEEEYPIQVQMIEMSHSFLTE
jgi:hypothetical protein